MRFNGSSGHGRSGTCRRLRRCCERRGFEEISIQFIPAQQCV